MAELTVERLREIVRYEPETGNFYWLVKPRNRPPGRAGSVTASNYREVKIGGRRYLAHRLAWFYVYGEWPRYQIDHINLVRSDNRLCNLREALPFQNMGNIGLNPRNKSGVKGVHFCKQTGKWRSCIKIRGKERNLGRFSTIEEAAKAYRSVAEAERGAFARRED